MVFQKDGFSKLGFSWYNNFFEKDFMAPTINFSSLFKNISPLLSYLISSFCTNKRVLEVIIRVAFTVIIKVLDELIFTIIFKQ